MPGRKSRIRKPVTGKKRTVTANRSSQSAVNSPSNRSQSKPKGSLSKKLLANLLEYYGVKIPDEQARLIWEYHTLLRDANTDSDLTRLHSFDSMVQRHYADCLLPQIYYKDK